MDIDNLIPLKFLFKTSKIVCIMILPIFRKSQIHIKNMSDWALWLAACMCLSYSYYVSLIHISINGNERESNVYGKG